MSKFLPNSFQTPNAYVDEYMHLLTSEEYKVLSYASRRIFGFQKRSDNISLSQFSDGAVYDEDGARDYGTGLNKATVRKALDALIHYKLIEQIAVNDPLENKGACYRLQLDSGMVDKAGLVARRELHAAAYKTRDNVTRMNAARGSKKAAPVLSDRTPPRSTTQNAPVLPHRTPPFYDVGTQKTVENQKKTRESARAKNLSPSIAVYFEVYKQLPHINGQSRIENEVRDIETWRRVVLKLKTNGTPPKNIGTLLDVYHETVAKPKPITRGAPALPVISGSDQIDELMRKQSVR